MKFTAVVQRDGGWFFAYCPEYESFEWELAVWLSPEYAESYNGQQGDRWDAQEDMALAGLGALIAALPCGILLGEARKW
jgi:uncharacterized membrane protein YjdF